MMFESSSKSRKSWDGQQMISLSQPFGRHLGFFGKHNKLLPPILGFRFRTSLSTLMPKINVIAAVEVEICAKMC